MSKINVLSIYEPAKLDDKSLKRAKDELNEKDAKQVANDIDYIRKWLLKQEHIKSKTDDDFILSFLRVAKFSYANAQQRIENYWTNRTVMKEIFFDRSYEDDSVMMEVADLGFTVVLPVVDNEGRRIVVNRPGLWDTDKYDFFDITKYMVSCLDVLVNDPRTQTNGVVILMDMTNLNSGHATNMTPARAQKMAKCLQDTLPMRLKEINYYNYPKIFDAIFGVIKMFLNDKIKKRLKFHGSDLVSVQKSISKEYLPKEYGGDLDSIKVLTENWNEYVKSKKSSLKAMENYGIDLEKAAKLNKVENKPGVNEVTGTFKKLNVD